MPFDRRKTVGADMTRCQMNRPGKNEAQRSRKVCGEKPFTGNRNTEKKDYRQFEYHPDDRRVQQDQAENG